MGVPGFVDGGVGAVADDAELLEVGEGEEGEGWWWWEVEVRQWR